MGTATMAVQRIQRTFFVFATGLVGSHRAWTAAVASFNSTHTDDATSIGGQHTEIESGEHAENNQPCGNDSHARDTWRDTL